MANLASFWVGDSLGPIELACLASFRRHGDDITLFSPTPLQLPAGVRWRDANDIMPCHRILKYRVNNSPALHADLFRYALMRDTHYTWVDLDVVALHPLDFDTAWIFAYEDATTVNNAVLRLPADSPALKLLLEFTPDTIGLPPFMQGRRRLKYQIRTLGRGLPIERWPWGAVGPRGLTHALRQTQEIGHALPMNVFYPVAKDDAEKFLIPGCLDAGSFGTDCRAVHLWAKELRLILAKKYGGKVPQGSFLDRALCGDM